MEAQWKQTCSPSVPRDHLIGQLYRDVSELKAQLENMKTEV